MARKLLLRRSAACTLSTTLPHQEGAFLARAPRQRSLPLLAELTTSFLLLGAPKSPTAIPHSCFQPPSSLSFRPLICSWPAAEAQSLPLWACWKGERVLLPEVLGKLAETPELAPAPARGTQSPRVPRDDLDKPHLPGRKARCSRRARHLEF